MDITQKLFTHIKQRYGIALEAHDFWDLLAHGIDMHLDYDYEKQKSLSFDLFPFNHSDEHLNYLKEELFENALMKVLFSMYPKSVQHDPNLAILTDDLFGAFLHTSLYEADTVYAQF